MFDEARPVDLQIKHQGKKMDQSICHGNKIGQITHHGIKKWANSRITAIKSAKSRIKEKRPNHRSRENPGRTNSQWLLAARCISCVLQQGKRGKHMIPWHFPTRQFPTATISHSTISHWTISHRQLPTVTISHWEHFPLGQFLTRTISYSIISHFANSHCDKILLVTKFIFRTTYFGQFSDNCLKWVWSECRRQMHRQKPHTDMIFL